MAEEALYAHELARESNETVANKHLWSDMDSLDSAVHYQMEQMNLSEVQIMWRLKRRTPCVLYYTSARSIITYNMLMSSRHRYLTGFYDSQGTQPLYTYDQFYNETYRDEAFIRNPSIQYKEWFYDRYNVIVGQLIQFYNKQMDKLEMIRRPELEYTPILLLLNDDDLYENCIDVVRFIRVFEKWALLVFRHEYTDNLEVMAKLEIDFYQAVNVLRTLAALIEQRKYLVAKFNSQRTNSLPPSTPNPLMNYRDYNVPPSFDVVPKTKFDQVWTDRMNPLDYGFNISRDHIHLEIGKLFQDKTFDSFHIDKSPSNRHVIPLPEIRLHTNLKTTNAYYMYNPNIAVGIEIPQMFYSYRAQSETIGAVVRYEPNYKFKLQYYNNTADIVYSSDMVVKTVLPESDNEFHLDSEKYGDTSCTITDNQFVLQYRDVRPSILLYIKHYLTKTVGTHEYIRFNNEAAYPKTKTVDGSSLEFRLNIFNYFQDRMFTIEKFQIDLYSKLHHKIRHVSKAKAREDQANNRYVLANCHNIKWAFKQVVNAFHELEYAINNTIPVDYYEYLQMEQVMATSYNSMYLMFCYLEERLDLYANLTTSGPQHFGFDYCQHNQIIDRFRVFSRYELQTSIESPVKYIDILDIPPDAGEIIKYHKKLDML